MGADPGRLRGMGSLEFAKKLLADAKVAVSPGIGFGQYGDDHVRFSLIENEARTRQAMRGLRDMFRKDGSLEGGARPVEAMEIIRITDDANKVVDRNGLRARKPSTGSCARSCRSITSKR